MRVCRTLLVVGLLVGLPSLWETLSFSWDPTFQAPSLRYGPTHTNYHAFREFTLAVGAVGTMLWVMSRREPDRTPALWWTMALAAVSYYGGWWLPWPLLGLHTPNLPSEVVHEAAALISGLAVALARRWFHPRAGTQVQLR